MNAPFLVSEKTHDVKSRGYRHRIGAELLRRVFAVDVLECPRFGSRMRLLAVIHPPEATRPVMEADVHEDAGSEDRKVAIRLVKEHP